MQVEPVIRAHSCDALPEVGTYTLLVVGNQDVFEYSNRVKYGISERDATFSRSMS